MLAKDIHTLNNIDSLGYYQGENFPKSTLSFHFSVPCIVLAAQYKLTPTFLPEAKRLEASCLVSPGLVNTRAVVLGPKKYFQELSSRDWRLKLAAKSDA